MIARIKKHRRLILIGMIVAMIAFTPFAKPVARWAYYRFIVPPPDKPMLPYGELRIGMDASYPPFGVDIGGELIGLDVDLAKALAEEMGVNIRFINMGYDGLYDSLLADQADIVISALRIDPLHYNEAQYSIPYFNAGQILVRPEDSGINTMEDLEGLHLAVEFGTEGDLEARAWQRRLQELTITSYESAAAALEAVANGEADAALIDAISAGLWLRDHDGTLAAAPDPITYDLYAIAIQVHNHKLGNAINETLQRLLDNGAVTDIIKNWL